MVILRKLVAQMLPAIQASHTAASHVPLLPAMVALLISIAVANAQENKDDDHPGIADKLIVDFKTLTPSAQTAALVKLASRPAFAERLIESLETKQIATRDVPAFVIKQVMAFKDKNLNARLVKAWGRVANIDPEKAVLIAKYRKMLTQKTIDQADLKLGTKLYAKNCGQCHKMNGAGGDIGPDLSGANRSNIDYWLENIVDPNALVAKDYQTTQILTIEGQILSGILVDEKSEAFTVQTPLERVSVSREDVDRIVPSENSIMPQGLLETLSNDSIAALFAFLMTED